MCICTFLFINKFHLLTFASPMQNEPMPMLARFTIHNCRCTRDHNRHFKTPTSVVTRGAAEFLKIITKRACANIYSLICTICRVHFARRRNGKSVVLVMTPFYACWFAQRDVPLAQHCYSRETDLTYWRCKLCSQYLCCTDMMACTTRLVECIACNYIGCKLYFWDIKDYGNCADDMVSAVWIHRVA